MSSFSLPLQKWRLFCFFGAKPRGLNFAEFHARGGRGLQRPTFRDLIPPWGHSPFGPGRSGTAPFRGGRSPGHRAAVPGRRARSTAGLGGGRRGHTRSWPAARAGRCAGTRRAMRVGGARARWARKPGRVGEAARGLGGCPGRGGAAACGPNAAKSGRGPGARRRPSGGAVPGGSGGARPGRRRWTLRHSALSPAACVGSGAHPGGAGSAARRKGAFSLYKEARRSAGFSLSNQSCSGPITLCFRSG